MSNNVQNNQQKQSVIAIAKTDDGFRAVEVRRQNGTFELVWAKSSTAGSTDWQRFATECGVTLEATSTSESAQDEDNRAVIIGFDSAGTAFYNINMPVVDEKEVESMVKMQAESQLPLPIEQMEMAWRIKKLRNNQQVVILAAARKQHLQAFVDKVRVIQPEQILLDCEAVVESWKTLFAGKEPNTVILSTGRRSIQMCLVEDGRLSNAVSVDIGTDDFAGGDIEQESETKERFIQDIRSVVDLFSQGKSTKLPIVALSDGGKSYTSLVSVLKQAGMNIQASLPAAKTLTGQQKLDAGDVYNYRVPIGLALMYLKSDVDGFDLFEELYQPGGEEEPTYWLYSPKVVGAAAAVMVIMFLVVSFMIDVASPGEIEKNLEQAGAGFDLNALIERQKLVKAIANNRPNLLELLNDIDSSARSTSSSLGGLAARGGRSGQRGIQLESFHFKKGQPVTITGVASDNDALYRFEQNLEEKLSIRDIKRAVSTSSASITAGTTAGGGRGTTTTAGAANGVGARGQAGAGNIQFTITFHYLSFTK